MSTLAEVYLWGTCIGVVSLGDESDVASFEYSRGFVGSGIEVAPLAMPLSGAVYSFPALSRQSFRGLPGLLADSLPDKFGNAVIDAWLDSQGRARGSLNSVERLCYTGSRGMGALEYVPALGLAPTAMDKLQIDALVALAERILSQRQGLSVSADGNAMEQIIRVGTSAGGARAKAVVAWNEKTGEFRSGQVDAGQGFGHWLMKLGGVESNGDKEGADAPSYTNIEYAYYLMARAAGIAMAECRLYEEGGRHHFLTRRSDRDEHSGDKIHMQSLGALAHFDFNDAGAHSYEQAVEVMRRIGLGQDEVEQLYRRMCLNVVARNQDDHVKNIAFLMDRRGGWRLAPAYDVTYAYNPGGLWTGSHQMRINGKRDDIDLDDLAAAARHMSIKASKARAIVQDVMDAARGWMGFAERGLVPEPQAEAIERTFVLI